MFVNRVERVCLIVPHDRKIGVYEEGYEVYLDVSYPDHHLANFLLKEVPEYPDQNRKDDEHDSPADRAVVQGIISLLSACHCRKPTLFIYVLRFTLV